MRRYGRRMSWWGWLLVWCGALVVVRAVAIVALAAARRRTDARALAGFIPDCLVPMRRLLADPRVPRRRKLLLASLVNYLVRREHRHGFFICSCVTSQKHRRSRPFSSAQRLA
jgi:hypothetical protein